MSPKKPTTKPKPKSTALSAITLPPGEFIVDRSRLIDFQQCPRLGYYAYGYNGVGLDPLRKSVYLLRGAALHAGIASLLTRDLSSSVIMKSTDLIVRETLANFEKEARKGMEIEKGEDSPPSIDEEKRIIEGALWAFNFVALPRIRAQYEVLDVEREEAVPLGPGVTLLARSDAVLRHKIDGSFHIWSLKTTSSYDSRKEADAQTDVQGLSEALAVEARLGKKVKSIQMCYLILGKRYVSKTDIGKEVITKTPFAWGYRRAGGGIGMGDEYYAEQYWKCSAPHITTHTKKASQCPGGKTHKIGDDFEIFPTDEYPGGVRGWIEALLEGITITPGASLFDDLLIMPPEYYRQERDVQSFKQQAYWQAKEIQTGLRNVDYVVQHKLNTELELDIHFRQHKHRCHYPGDCDFLKLCFPPPGEREAILGDPLKFGYKLREPNHPAELLVLRTTEGTK